MNEFDEKLEGKVTRKNYDDVLRKRFGANFGGKRPLKITRPNKPVRIENEFQIDIRFSQGIPDIRIFDNSSQMISVGYFKKNENIGILYIDEGVLGGTYELRRTFEKGIGYRLTHVDSRTLKPLYNSLKQEFINTILDN